MMRSQNIERQKKLIKELQNQAEAKLFQFEKSLSTERNALQVKIDEQKTKKLALESEKEEMKNKNLVLLEEI